MKRGFEDCSELKETCGSQFLQYLAKTALASRLALNEQKLAIYKDADSLTNTCAGCHMPVSSLGVWDSCKGGCQQVVKCDWEFCKEQEDFHACANCKRIGWCKRIDAKRIIYCRICNKSICGDDECFSECLFCTDTWYSACRSCVNVSTPHIVQIGPSRNKERLLCAHHKSVMDQDTIFILSCELCAPYGGNVKHCLDFRCWRFICPHKGPSKNYCQEHAADHK